MNNREQSFQELVQQAVMKNRNGMKTVIDVDSIIGMLYRETANVASARTDNGEADYDEILICFVQICAALQLASEFIGMTATQEEDFEVEKRFDEYQEEVRDFIIQLTKTSKIGQPKQKGGEPIALFSMEMSKIKELLKGRF